MQIFRNFLWQWQFFQKCALVHSKIKLLSFPRVYNVAMFHAFWIPPRCCSQAMLHWEDCSAIKLCAFSDYWTLLEVTRGYLNSFFWVESICGETGQTGVLKRSRWQQRSHVSGDKTWAGSSKFPLLLHIFLCDSLVNASVLYCAFKKARIPLLWFLVAESTIISLPHFAQKQKDSAQC